MYILIIAITLPKELDNIYELIINENGDITKDWEGNLNIDISNISENVNKLVFLARNM